MCQSDPSSQRVVRWYCPNCGQIYFGDNPPDICDFCGDFTTWKPLRIPPNPDPSPKRRDDDDDMIQLPLF